MAEEAQRLRALGIEEGAEVSVAHRGVFGARDPIAIEIGRMTVALRRVHARAMQVEAGQVEAGQVEAGQVEAGQVEAGQVETALADLGAAVP